MKILLCPYNFFHSDQQGSGIAGGEIYLERLCLHLIEQGHEIKAIVGCKIAYVHKGIECVPQGSGVNMFTEHCDLLRWCDVIFTQLLGNAYGYNRANQFKKPLIFIAHNNSTQYAVKHGHKDLTHIIYNSYQLREDTHKDFGHFNSIVLHPLQSGYSRRQGTKITLINCNHNKGGHQFAEIASRLPNYQFLGVFGGYGEQIEAQLPNITYVKNGCDMAEIYASTKVLLALSEFESYSQAASEAMECGIPVIAHPTKGLLENLSGAGIFIDRNNIDKIVQTLIYLINDETAYQKQSDIVYERAMCVAGKSKEELSRFDEWLNKIK